jgi:membrane protein implicated in regulation of membrane protease activity
VIQLPDPVLFWHWWALGGVLAIVEALAPGFMFLWVGVAAGLVGCLLLAWPALSLPAQVVAFAVLSVVSVVAWRWFQKAHPIRTDEPNLNRRGAQYIGQRGGLVEPIVHGRGRIRLGDSSWPVSGPDLPAGASVEVIGADGTLLRVQPVAAPLSGPEPPPATGAATTPEESAA